MTQLTVAPTRRCIGSARFGIQAHDALVTDFPIQPSRRDGRGVLCREHWTVYARALREARKKAG